MESYLQWLGQFLPNKIAGHTRFLKGASDIWVSFTTKISYVKPMTSTFYIHRNTRETLSFRGILAGFLRVTALVKIQY